MKEDTTLPGLQDRSRSDDHRFDLLDEVLGNLTLYVESPEALAEHLATLGGKRRPAALRAHAERLFVLARDVYGDDRQGAGVRRRPFCVYYGTGKVEELAGFETVVVQPGQHDVQDIRRLVRGGTRVLAYLSLGEDNGPDAPWHMGSRNTVWNTRYVRLNDPGWVRHVAEHVEGAADYSGFFLDTIEMVDVHPEARGDMLTLLGKVRRWAPGSYLLANRGFSLLSHLSKLVDGVLIESLSTTWLDGYRRLDPQGLDFTAAMKARVEHAKLDVYGLDYAVTPTLERFARQRAARLRVPTFVSTRDLHHL
ncbi:endo alpha-1,4 polygalactosaminidase [Deinococcus pimensis]|uniref:endo alpha-1,4 polygalactosaminidase n=1 Tax=Deinococcus pimensis TaxID=309888 RepID=UPI0004AE0ADC|nr:endo alpha-1,4 polygalactosaminidase [Deinococcus pimensis]